MQYWLFKSEPDTYSIADLERDKEEPWTGVRNYQARNFMRDVMRVGDQILYYHSSTQPPGVVGLAEVASEAYADPTQFDCASEYFDPKATAEKPIWFLVAIRFVKEFERKVTLSELCSNPKTSTMRVCARGNRLSITPVTESEFMAVLNLAE